MSTKVQDTIRRASEAAVEFNYHLQRGDGEKIAGSLSAGFGMLRNTLFHRVHTDVEEILGMDSMLMPVSPNKVETASKAEIEVYFIACSIDEVRERKWVPDAEWYGRWLARLRLGDSALTSGVTKRIAQYLEKNSEERRGHFCDILDRAIPEARKAPLVMHRLLPLAASIATALAFGDVFRAADLRNQQIAILPAIADCHDCHGRPMENGEACPTCGNPLWKFDWLTSD